MERQLPSRTEEAPEAVSDLLQRLRSEHSHGLSDDAADEIERLHGFLIEIAGPGTMDEKTYLARQALDTKRVTVHGPQCLCSRFEAQRAVHTL